jgi:arginase family enzyme
MSLVAELSLENAHILLQKTVSRLIGLGATYCVACFRSFFVLVLLEGVIPFVVGGSNDQSYPNASALLDHATDNVSFLISFELTAGFLPQVFVVNIDAHLDVRPLKEGIGVCTANCR